MSDRLEPKVRLCFNTFYSLETRWADNDIYGHVNNVAYYEYFDSVVNRFLIDKGGLDPAKDPVVGYVVNSSASYFSSISYPQKVDVGLRINRMGRKSITWGLGVFCPTESLCRVTGSFTHAFVARATGASVEIPPRIREAVEKLSA